MSGDEKAAILDSDFFHFRRTEVMVDGEILDRLSHSSGSESINLS